MASNVSFTFIPTPPVYLNPSHFIFSEHHRVLIRKITYNDSKYLLEAYYVWESCSALQVEQWTRQTWLEYYVCEWEPAVCCQGEQGPLSVNTPVFICTNTTTFSNPEFILSHFSFILLLLVPTTNSFLTTKSWERSDFCLGLPYNIATLSSVPGKKWLLSLYMSKEMKAPRVAAREPWIIQHWRQFIWTLVQVNKDLCFLIGGSFVFCFVLFLKGSVSCPHTLNIPVILVSQSRYNNIKT